MKKIPAARKFPTPHLTPHFLMGCPLVKSILERTGFSPPLTP